MNAIEKYRAQLAAAPALAEELTKERVDLSVQLSDARRVVRSIEESISEIDRALEALKPPKGRG